MKRPPGLLLLRRAPGLRARAASGVLPQLLKRLRLNEAVISWMAQAASGRGGSGMLPQLNAVSPKPVQVHQGLQNGEKFIKWDEVNNFFLEQ